MFLKKRGIILLFLLTLLIPATHGMGFGGKDAHITFEPGLEQTFSWNLITTSNIERDYSVTASGDLSEYVEISPATLLENVKPNENPIITATLKLPQQEPTAGMHIIRITMSELPTQQEQQSGIIALSGAIAKIHVNVLYQGIYLQPTLDVSDINLGENIIPTILLSNFGKQKIQSLRAKIEILDSQNNTITQHQTQTISVESNSQQTLKPEISSNLLQSGVYTLKATIFWDNNQTILTEPFRVGIMDILLMQTSTNLTLNKINEFNIVVKSLWNGEIENLFAEITLANQTVTTPTKKLQAWETTTLTGHIAPTNLEPTTHEIQIKLNYGTLSKTTTKDILLIKEKKQFAISTTTMLVILLTLVTLLIIINSYLLIKKKK